MLRDPLAWIYRKVLDVTTTVCLNEKFEDEQQINIETCASG